MGSNEHNAAYLESQAGATDELRDAMARSPRLLDDDPSPMQVEIYRRMTPEQRWRAAHRLYWTCRRHKVAFLRSQHPDWPNDRVEDEVRRIFQNART